MEKEMHISAALAAFQHFSISAFQLFSPKSGS
jgi:hypothetical protein